MLNKLVYLIMDMMRPFKIMYKGQEVQVAPKKIGIDTLFVVQFSPPDKPLILTKALRSGGGSFWTSIPEGRQKEAEQIGPMITAHFQQAVTAGS